MSEISFSHKLEAWLSSKNPKTFGDLEDIFREKSFAVAFLLLMATAALPLPTGGITHVFEIITIILATELIIGRKTMWIPNKWRQRNLGQTLQRKALPKLVKFIKWFEERSQKRMVSLIDNDRFLRLIGLLVLVLAVAALLAPPFTGLDTLPALGIVIMSLALILDDALLILVGLAIGVAGVIVEISLGRAILHFLHF